MNVCCGFICANFELMISRTQCHKLSDALGENVVDVDNI